MNVHFAGHRPAHREFLAVILVVLATSGMAAQVQHTDHDHAESFEQHEAHEHGKVTFNVAVDGGQLVVELVSPADHVLGFEHAPRTAAEKAVMRDKAAWFAAGKELIAYPSAADCQFEKADVRAPDAATGTGHADYRAILSYRCGQPQRLEWVQLVMLSGLREVKSAQVNVVSGSRQSSQAVKTATTRVMLR